MTINAKYCMHTIMRLLPLASLCKHTDVVTLDYAHFDIVRGFYCGMLVPLHCHLCEVDIATFAIALEGGQQLHE